MKKLLHIIFPLLLSIVAKAQPYIITSYIDSSVISGSDSSTLQTLTYSGQTMNWVYDRRIEDWELINTYVFEIIYTDGITAQVQVNPEFGSETSALVEAEKYAFIFGQLPACLRSEVHKIWIHQGTESFGGGFNAVLIHIGQSADYESLGILEEVLVHESTHTALDPVHASSPGWQNAQNADSTFISTYAQASPLVEDLSESFLTWIMVRQCSRRISQIDSLTISATIPNRLAYLDAQNFNMFPLCIDQEAGIIQNSDQTIFVYPNPTTGECFIEADPSEAGSNYQIFDQIGNLLFENSLNAETIQIDLFDFPQGVYFLIAGKEVKQTVRIIKF